MKSHFKVNKQERSGIFFLLLIVIILQGIYFYVKTNPSSKPSKISINMMAESKLDSLRLLALKKDSVKIFPFNPNYITDYKGYALGMSLEELDRLFAYRKQRKFINSVDDFQMVTKVSDSLLKTMSPYFKFPEWTQKNKPRFVKGKSNGISKEKKVDKVSDINLATATDLKTIRGIGDKLSARIVKFRDRLGGFVINEQLNDVYGLEPDVAKEVLDKFVVIQSPKVEKININVSSASQISQLVYISYVVADKIVAYREVNGRINSFDELTTIEGFPSEKLDRITLYLSL
ncbi:helix-hairpin-helix domain-containing protein [Flagellimonas sp. CMM7]|uniref:ComEA family DNA-binding protein n=1 Tax=Flagellimonas sp. CMM7 TaxID=2654676 RepID=UPI0013D5DEAA|nr:helix-hairpin-helix domain-containing protein [Flagellimonas sp. CMM7]UII80508.1 helix-hairpin-helix domain-containing protein [Flagellimonas sp. CMM7]